MSFQFSYIKRGGGVFFGSRYISSVSSSVLEEIYSPYMRREIHGSREQNIEKFIDIPYNIVHRMLYELVHIRYMYILIHTFLLL